MHGDLCSSTFDGCVPSCTPRCEHAICCSVAMCLSRPDLVFQDMMIPWGRLMIHSM